MQSVKNLWRVGSERFERSTDSQSYVGNRAIEDSMPIDDPKNSSRQSNSWKGRFRDPMGGRNKILPSDHKIGCWSELQKSIFVIFPRKVARTQSTVLITIAKKHDLVSTTTPISFERSESTLLLISSEDF